MAQGWGEDRKGNDHAGKAEGKKEAPLGDGAKEGFATPLAFETRNLSLAGDPLARTAGSQLADILARARPSRVKTDHPIVVLVWRDRQNMPVLEVALPLNLKP
jgi:hypothetical protein